MPRRPGIVASLAAIACLTSAPAHAAAGSSVLHRATPASAPAPDAEAPTKADVSPPAESVIPARSSAIDAIFVADALVAAGTSPEDAVAQVAMLTEADLAVLAGHPSMVQVAGDNAALTRNLILGLLLLGAIIALAAASEGGGAVVTN